MAEQNRVEENSARPREAPMVAPLLREMPPGLRADDLHELRVRIPVDLHRQLLSLKVLRGRSLAETVSLALDVYFSQREKTQPAPKT